MLGLALGILSSVAVAAPIPGFTPAPVSPGSVLSDAAYTASACFDNLSAADTGFGPSLQVVVPAGSTLVGATSYGGAQTIVAVGTCSAPGGCATGFVNPDTRATVPLATGESLAIVRIALPSIAPDQPPACALLNLDLGDVTAAPLGTTRQLRLTPVFSLGADALDNPGSDPAVVGPTSPLDVTPSLLQLTKSIAAPEGETATGPNYPRTIRLALRLAPGVTMTNIDIADALPGSLQFIPGTDTVTGCAGAVTNVDTPVPGTPGQAITRRCATATGVAGADTLVMQFQVFVPYLAGLISPVIEPASPIRVIPNVAGASALYVPAGSPPGTPPATIFSNASAEITAKLATMRKSVSVVTDADGNGIGPGDVLRYRLEYELSDYFAMDLGGAGRLRFTDTLGDGQTFLGCANAGTTISAFENGTIVAAQPYGASGCSAAPKNALGQTVITFDVGSRLSPLLGARLDGDLVSPDAAQAGATRVVVEFLVSVDTAFSQSPFPGPGDPALATGDRIGNQVVADGTSAGFVFADGSSTTSNILVATFGKSVYAINGVAPPPPGIVVGFGDTVTYRLRTAIPIASFTSFRLTDFLPGPVFTIAGFNPAGDAAIAKSGTPPAAGRWTLGPDDTFTSLGGTVQNLTPAVTTSGVNNAILFTYPAYDVQGPNEVVDILFTVAATDATYADGLAVTNVGVSETTNSFGQVSQNVDPVAVQSRAPRLSLAKAILATSNPACVTDTPPADYDGAVRGCDAGDTLDFRLTLQNSGRLAARNVRLDDDQGNPAAGFGGTCALLAVTDGNGVPVPATGSLFDTSANGGLTIAQIPADLSTAVLPGETVRVDYRCTVSPAALPGLPARNFDNTARLKYYASDPAQTTNPAANYASNTSFPGPNVKRTRIAIADVQSIAKAITASSVAQTATPNVNAGETLTFAITVTLAEGQYQNFSLGDSLATVPPVSCAAPGYTCSPNVSVAGTTVAVASTAGSTPGTITYTYSAAVVASGTNTATVQATNAPARTASTSWVRVNPAPAVSKSFNPGTADAGDTVQVRLGWQNNSAASPMFRCVVSDPVNVTIFDPATITPVTTPAGYAFSANLATGVVTYTATDSTVPCPTVPPAGAVFSVGLRTTASAGGSVGNTASLAANTLPTPQSGGANVTGSANASLNLGAPAATTKVIEVTSEPDGVTAGSSFAIGERVTYRVGFTFPDGVTRAVRLVDQMTGGLANLAYIPGSARLARSTAALTAASNPGGINAAGPGIFVPVTPQCVGTSPCSGNQIRFDLGDVTNDPLTGASTDYYTLEIGFQVRNVAANVGNATRDNRGQVIYRPFGAASDQTLNGGVARGRIVAPAIGVTKTAGPLVFIGSGTVTYTVTISNVAAGAGAGPAFDLDFVDDLPPELSNPVLAGPVPPGTTVSIAGNRISGTIARLDPGASATFTYVAGIQATAPIGATIVNGVVVTGTSLPGPNGTAGATPGAPGAVDGERTGAGGVNNLYDEAGTVFVNGRIALFKRLRNAQVRYPIGDTVDYEFLVVTSTGTTSSVVVTDTLPAGLRYVPGSATVSVVNGPIATTRPGLPPVEAGSQLVFDFGDVVASAPGYLLVRFSAYVDNVLGNQEGTELTNTAVLAYRDPATGATTTAPPAEAPAVRVGEPNLSMTKSVLAGATGADAGDPVDYRVEVRNDGSVDARRVDIRDVLPAGLAQITGITVQTAGTVVLEGTATPVTSANVQVTTTSQPGDTLDVATLAADGTDTIAMGPGASLVIDFRAIVQPSVVPGQVIANTTRATYASLAACTPPATCRDGSGGPAVDDDDDSVLNNYRERASATITAASPVAIDKQVSPGSSPVGGTVTFRLRVTVIEGTTPAVTVTDVLPAGLTYVSHQIAVGNLGMVFGNPAYDTRLGAGQTVQFNLGDVTNPGNGSATDDFVDVEIVARVDNVAGNQDRVVLRNGEAAAASPVSVTFGPGTVVPFDADPAVPGAQGVPVTVTEPRLALRKGVDPASQALGALVTFNLEVAHATGSTADAFDIVISDTLPAGLTFEPGSVEPPGTIGVVAGQVVGFAISSLTRADGQARISYKARVNPGAAVGVPLVNAAEARWASLPGATGAPDSGRTGAGGLNDYVTTDTASVTPNAANQIEALKTVAIAVDADASGSLTPGDTLEYTIVLSNNGPAVTGVVFDDPTPLNTTYVPGSVTTTKGAASGPSVRVVIGPMAAAETVTIRFRVTVDFGTPAGTVISNQGVVDSDSTVPEPTDADGNDANGDQPTDIAVQGLPPTIGLGQLYAPKRVALLQDADASGTVTQGDRMRYTLELRNRGAIPLTGVSLADVIPAGLAYVAGSATATAGTVAVAGSAVNWSGVGTLAPGAAVTATFDVTIVAVTPPQQAYVNQGTAVSAETGAVRTDGNGDPSDGNSPTVFVAVGAGGTAAPVLDVQKRWTVLTDTPPLGVSSPGDTIRYTITVVNTGSGPAANVRLTDPVPVCTGALNPCTAFVAGSLVTSQGAIVSSNPVDVNLGPLGIGQAATVSFAVTIAPATANGTIIANQAVVTANGGISVPSDDNGIAADGRNPTLTPVNTGAAEPVSVSKAILGTSEPDADTAGVRVAIGEVVRFRVTAVFPPGLTRNGAIGDLLPAGFAYVPGSARLARNFDTALVASLDPGGVNARASGVFGPLPDGIGGLESTVRPNGATLFGVRLGDVTNSDADPGTESYTLEYRAVAANIAANRAGVRVDNASAAIYDDVLGQQRVAGPVTAGASIVEPAVTLSAAAVPGRVPPAGGPTRVTLVIRNDTGTTVSPAHDLRLRGQLPAVFTQVGARTITSSGATGVVDLTVGTLLRINVGRLAPGGQVTIAFDATVGPNPPIGVRVLTFTADWTSLAGSQGAGADGVAAPGAPGSATGERTGDGGVNSYAASADATILVAPLEVPTLSSAMLAVLALFLGYTGWRRSRRAG